MRAEPVAVTAVFLDSERTRLEILRRDLESAGAAWNFLLCTTLEEAVTNLARTTQIDAVITVLDSAEEDCAALFRSARWHHPDSFRLLLSGSRTEPEPIARIPEVQLFLPAPDVRAVLDVVQRRVEVRRRLADPALRRLIVELDVLPSPPAHVVRLNEVLAGPEPSIGDIGQIVGTDPAMTAKLLQLVNSGFFGLQHQISEINRAIAYLGLETTRDLLSAVELVRAFEAPVPELAGALDDLHAHSLGVAELARSFLSAHRHPSHDAFTGGLLHDIGLFALLSASPERFVALRDAVRHTGIPLAECELEILGARHAHLGAYLLTLWGLPHHLVETVARSHDADLIVDHTLNPVHAVFVAEQVSNVMNTSRSGWEGGMLPDPGYLGDLGLDTTVSQLIARADY